MKPDACAGLRVQSERRRWAPDAARAIGLSGLDDDPRAPKFRERHRNSRAREPRRASDLGRRSRAALAQDTDYAPLRRRGVAVAEQTLQFNVGQDRDRRCPRSAPDWPRSIDTLFRSK